jgi:DNA-binding CsgD family transcriptional regulator
MQACSGVAEFGPDGRALVRVPEWFVPGDRMLHYQLTCVGGFAPVFVEEELARGAFRIAGGESGVKVCWQLSAAPGTVEREPPPQPNVTLAPRVRETLEVLMTGASNKEIATRLSISQNTVHQYVKALLRAYSVGSRAELVARLLATCNCGSGAAAHNLRQ